MIEEINDALQTTDTQNDVAHELLDNSPYPEVRAAVPNHDEGGHTNTVRAWTVGLLFATIGSALNMLFSMSQPYIVILSYVRAGRGLSCRCGVGESHARYEVQTL